VGVAGPPDGAGGPDDRAPRNAGLSTPAKIAASAFVAILYAVGMSLRGDVLPGVVGGLLAGVLCFLVLREIEERRRRRP
jgi:hypothetical protein